MNVCYYLEPLGPTREDSNWIRLRWRPIKHEGVGEGVREGTWNIYTGRLFSDWRKLGFDISLQRHGNYGYAHRCFTARIQLWWFDINFWIKWNFSCSRKGPNDGKYGPILPAEKGA